MFLKPMLRESGKAWSLVSDAGAKVVAESVEGAFESKTRKKGLLGRTGLDGAALVIAPCSAVHTFFMQFPIDVVFTDRDGRVLKVCHSVRPWRIAASWRAFAAIELDAGAAARSDVTIGQLLSLSPQ